MWSGKFDHFMGGGGAAMVAGQGNPTPLEDFEQKTGIFQSDFFFMMNWRMTIVAIPRRAFSATK